MQSKGKQMSINCSGTIFFPPFLLNNLSNLNCTATANVYLQAVQSINSWTNTFVGRYYGHCQSISLRLSLTYLTMAMGMSSPLHHRHSPPSLNMPCRVTILLSCPSAINPSCITSARIRNRYRTLNNAIHCTQRSTIHIYIYIYI
jgi:hypothetical protein